MAAVPENHVALTSRTAQDTTSSARLVSAEVGAEASPSGRGADKELSSLEEALAKLRLRAGGSQRVRAERLFRALRRSA